MNIETDAEKSASARNRIIALVLGSQCCIALIALTFGFYQQSLRKKNAEAAVAQKQEITIKLKSAIKDLESCGNK